MKPWKAIVHERDKEKCQHCKTKGCKTNQLTVHHILPKSLGGADSPENGLLLCWRCHCALHQTKGYPHSHKKAKKKKRRNKRKNKRRY